MRRRKGEVESQYISEVSTSASEAQVAGRPQVIDVPEEKETSAATASVPADIQRIELEKYGDGKPRRITIRARITHGNRG